MKKIMFNDSYDLTKAVLEGRKTMTRRVTNFNPADSPLVSFNVLPYNEVSESVVIQRLWRGSYNTSHHLTPKFKVGEVVAVAQSLRDMGYDPRDTKHKSGAIWGLDHTPAWTNKMFVSASECIHRIRITNVRVERLQDISDEDVYKEGFIKEAVNNGWGNYAYHYEAMLVYYDRLGRSKEIRSRNPREAFADLIDKISGKGTWYRNPWVFVYEFELVK